jgi:hypothetical protein
MSYENPKRAIDTQSAQHIQNVQNSLAQSFGNYAKTVGSLAQQKFAKEQKQLEQERKNALKRQEKLIKERQDGFISLIGINDPVLGNRFQELARTAVDQAYLIKRDNPNGMSLYDQTIVNNTSSLAKDTLGALTNMGVLIDGARKAITRTGKRGGAAPNQPKDAQGVRGGNLAFARAMGDVGTAEYIKNLDFDLTNQNGTDFRFSTSELLEDGSYLKGNLNSAQMRKWQENPKEGYYVTIPDNQEDMTSTVNEYGLGQGKNLNRGMASSVLGADIYIEDYVYNAATKANDKVRILDRSIVLERLREGSKNQIMNGMTKNSRVALINFYNGLNKTEEQKSKLEIIGYEDDLSKEQLEKLVTDYNEIQYDSYVNNTPEVIMAGKAIKELTPAQQKAMNKDLLITSQARDIFEAIINPMANSQLNKLGTYSRANGQEFASVTQDIDDYGPNEGKQNGIFTIVDTQLKDIQKDGNVQQTSQTFNLYEPLLRSAFALRLVPKGEQKRNELIEMLAKKYPTPEKETKKLKFNPITKKNQ